MARVFGVRQFAGRLLARVSAYYHDIGKMRMPDYFIENQQVSDSRHGKLAPHMSSIILIAHVKEGAELARQYKLPKTVTDIIQQHHGTRLMSYFYQKAKDQTGGAPVGENGPGGIIMPERLRRGGVLE